MTRAKTITILAILLVVLCLTSCSTTWKKTQGLNAEVAYRLVGYDYIFSLDGNEVTFKYVDAVGDDEVPVIAAALMGVLPGAVGYEAPIGGTIVLKAKANLTAVQFNEFVAAAQALIYDTIY